MLHTSAKILPVTAFPYVRFEVESWSVPMLIKYSWHQSGPDTCPGIRPRQWLAKFMLMYGLAELPKLGVVPIRMDSRIKTPFPCA